MSHFFLPHYLLKLDYLHFFSTINGYWIHFGLWESWKSLQEAKGHRFSYFMKYTVGLSVTVLQLAATTIVFRLAQDSDFQVRPEYEDYLLGYWGQSCSISPVTEDL